MGQFANLPEHAVGLCGALPDPLLFAPSDLILGGAVFAAALSILLLASVSLMMK
jgi:hypothetical protein